MNNLTGWPFYDPLGKLVVTTDVMNKHVSVGKERVYDQELIDARVISLLANSREINTDNFDVLAYELPTYPPSMFNPGVEIKITKSKSTLKLQVVISERNCPTPETFICDVSALIWVLTWPSDELHVYVDAFLLFVHQALHVTLVFDGYFPNSTNTNTKKKIQLNAMLVEGPLNSDYNTNATQKHTLTNAGVSDVPVEIVDGVRIDQHDLCSTQEEADIIITQRATSCSLSGKCVRSSRYCSFIAWRRQGNCYQNYQEGNTLPL